MNGKQTKDFYYLQVQGLANVEADNVEALNTCITRAKVYWLSDNGQMTDFTKCTHYNLCKKTINWTSDLV